jgi:hypothetical protein
LFYVIGLGWSGFLIADEIDSGFEEFLLLLPGTAFFSLKRMPIGSSLGFMTESDDFLFVAA